MINNFEIRKQSLKTLEDEILKKIFRDVEFKSSDQLITNEVRSKMIFPSEAKRNLNINR